MIFNSLLYHKIFDWSKLKAFADYNLNVAKKIEIPIQSRLPAFSPFPTMFSKAFFPRVVKSQDCVVRN